MPAAPMSTPTSQNPFRFVSSVIEQMISPISRNASPPSNRSACRTVKSRSSSKFFASLLTSTLSRLVRRFGRNHLKRFVSRRQCSVYILTRVHCRNKCSLKLRRRQKYSSVEHLSKKPGVSLGVGALGIRVIFHRPQREKYGG